MKTNVVAIKKDAVPGIDGDAGKASQESAPLTIGAEPDLSELVTPSDTYIFLFDDDPRSWLAVKEIAEKYAADPELRFSDADAAEVKQSVDNLVDALLDEFPPENN